MKLLSLCFALPLLAQAGPLTLTIEQAREIALRNHPAIAARRYRAEAAGQQPLQISAALAPQLNSGTVASATNPDGRLAFQGLNSPLLFSRAATGAQLSQVLTDFGRTHLMAEAARLRAQGQRQMVQVSRLEVLTEVDRTFYSVLRAKEILRVAEETLLARQTVVDQVEALAGSQLRSTLDVSFAKVNLADARLLAVQARNQLEASEADLAMALGLSEKPVFDLRDRPLNQVLPDDAETLVRAAIAERPELKMIELELLSLDAELEGQKRQTKPVVSAIGAFGLIPVSQGHRPLHYSAAGINISLPILNGKLFTAQQTETALRIRAVEKEKQERQNRLARDVRTAYLNARTAYERLQVTQDLLTQAKLSLDLAQTRYDLGLSSIVELGTAQLNLTSAEVAATSARYEYQILRSVLKYQLGENPI
jgi:outer membrane protein